MTASYTDGHGTAESVSSSATAAVANVNDAPTGSVTITGTPTQGQTLTAANTLADADGLGAISYQWNADGVAIGGATGSTLVLGQAEVGKAITVTASYTDGQGTAESASSAATAAVANVNDAPTGSVTITGTASQGQTLTAANSLADADGLGTISYQWKADGVVISGATGSTLLLGQAQVGRVISVTASYTDGFGVAESVSSAGTAAVANVNDAPTGTLTINGTATRGEPLTVVDTLADADGLGTVSYQWAADGVDIGGANGNSFTPGVAQVGQTITVRASYTDGFGAAESVTSDPTAAVTNFNNPATGSVTVSGTPTQGQTLTASNTLADADSLGTISYQWRADGVAIGGATGSTLLLGQAQVGRVISVTALYTDGYGTAESVNSAATAAVANVNDASTGSVTITGTPTQGQTLTASNSLADADGLGTISYQWQADRAAISGATGGTLVLGQAQVGKTITVTASYTDGFGTTESVGSAATAAVANVNDAPTGSVTITGTPAQGQTLTASNSVADADGLGTISYQWQADGVAISGAVGNTLLLGQAQVGKAISALASYTDAAGAVERVSSTATLTVTNVNDAPSGSVTIGGTATQGQTLTAANTLADPDGPARLAISYQWQADGVDIDGAAGSTLRLGQAQVGKAISVVARYTDAFGSAARVSSAATTAVANLNDDPSGSVTIIGTTTQDQTLSVNQNLADADGLGTISYQWRANGVDIAGATNTSLVLGRAEVGKQIIVIASYTDALGTAERVISAATAPVVGVNQPPALAQGLVDQTAIQGTTLQFSLPPTAFTDADTDAGDTLRYAATLADGSALPSWLRFDADSQRFQVTPPAQGQAGSVVVRVVATDSAGATAQLLFAIAVLPPAVLPVTPSAALNPTPVQPAEVTTAEAAPDAPAEASVAVLVVAPLPEQVAADAAPNAVPQETQGQRFASPAEALAAEPPKLRLASRADAVLAAEPVLQYTDLARAQLGALVQLLQGDDLQGKLDELRRQMAESTDAQRTLVASSVAVSTGLSVGYVVWLLRGGVLLSSMLSALPAWQLIDPMPVLAAAGAVTRRRGAGPNDDPDVERLFGRDARPAQPAEPATDATLAAPDQPDADGRISPREPPSP